MTVVDPSGNDDHGRMPVTSVDRPWITRGVSHATLEGRPPTTAITRQENADCPSYTRNHLAFLLRNARERKRLPFLTFFRILVAKRKKEKKKKNLKSSTGQKYEFGPSPNAGFLEWRPHGFHGWSY